MIKDGSYDADRYEECYGRIPSFLGGILHTLGVAVATSAPKQI
jgi:hypothetical protein